MDVLAERILLDLRNTFKKDPLIDEFDVLPVHESVSNKCPVIHVDHKIALEDWCVKHVYVYAYSKFFAWRKRPYKIDSECFLTWTSAILLINPEVETVWNARKEFVCQNLLLPENELKFSELVLSRKPKSSPVYAHRKWVLLEYFQGKVSPCSLQQVVDHEFKLCSRVANLYPNNYYAWCHRSWLMKEICHNCHKIVSEELTCMEKWVSTHVSDHCGFHYRQYLLSCYSGDDEGIVTCPLHATGDDSCSPKQTALFAPLLRQEMSLLCNLQAAYLGHETLWYHRRFLIHEFHKLEVSIVKDGEETGSCKRHKWDKGQEWDTAMEESFLVESFKRASGNDWEQTLIERHIKWLKNVVYWSVSLTPS
ncbi:protein prenyltransferase alpha subunit repeat-containing protein 1-like [Argiope bruennichi]|uniref:protein prenyltransferase alpha subunit repeat-containing protein 1-like n=1 Tax=Argiope bruennichi TaxID=94029 RepID=UPI0024946D37|nr:protein prenyltransferase alpha subunit repeat-containing protein 1-like [Argiope bruennichi]XP_055952500.1 protein prenyltransferase alpha subunit repeat-containing protein 1-like [Argiope bruennichi]